MYDGRSETEAMAGIATQTMLAKQASAMNHRPTKRQELEQQREILLQHIEKIDQAISALDRNPGAEEVMNAIDRCRF